MKVSGTAVVIGGGLVGMEAAEYLAENGCKVTVLKCFRRYALISGLSGKFVLWKK